MKNTACLGSDISLTLHQSRMSYGVQIVGISNMTPHVALQNDLELLEGIEEFQVNRWLHLECPGATSAQNTVLESS